MEEVEDYYNKGAHSCPTDKVDKKMDFIGWEVCSTGALNLCIANYQAIMAVYSLILWEHLVAEIDLLPEDKLSLAHVLQAEATKLSRKQMNKGR